MPDLLTTLALLLPPALALFAGRCGKNPTGR
jgi:hypothetical protein